MKIQIEHKWGHCSRQHLCLPTRCNHDISDYGIADSGVRIKGIKAQQAFLQVIDNLTGTTLAMLTGIQTPCVTLWEVPDHPLRGRVGCGLMSFFLG